jgi:hypothetical protein
MIPKRGQQRTKNQKERPEWQEDSTGVLPS